MMKNVVGKHIKEIREKAGISQEQLAIRLEMAGWQVDRFIVSKIERGERQVLDTEVQLIAKVLKVPVSSLFGKDE
jgi:transcriptional regulator with XRE-family HTH domain